jgi:hypothetical protein
MSSDITTKLNEHLQRILFEQKKSSGIMLDTDDISLIFRTLRRYDKELTPLLETVEKIIYKCIDIDDFFVKNSIKEILEYYNIINNQNIMRIRHKLFFTESKQLVKKIYFTDAILEQIRIEFNTYKIFDKVIS